MRYLSNRFHPPLQRPTTKGDLLAYDGTVLRRVGAGDEGQALLAAPDADAGLGWGEAGGGGGGAPVVLITDQWADAKDVATVVINDEDPASLQAAITEYAHYGHIGLQGWWYLDDFTITVPNRTVIEGIGYLVFDASSPGQIVLGEDCGLDNARFYDYIQVEMGTRAWADRIECWGEGDARAEGDRKFLVMKGENNYLGRFFAWSGDWDDGYISIESPGSFTNIDWIRIQGSSSMGVVIGQRQRVRIGTLIADTVDGTALQMNSTYDAQIDYLDVFGCGDEDVPAVVIDGGYRVNILSGRFDGNGWTNVDSAILIKDSEYVTIGEAFEIHYHWFGHGIHLQDSSHCRILGTVRFVDGGDNIRLSGSSSDNLIRANIEPEPEATEWGINIVDATCERNVVIGNTNFGDPDDYVQGVFNDGGTGTIIKYPDPLYGDNYFGESSEL